MHDRSSGTPVGFPILRWLSGKGYPWWLTGLIWLLVIFPAQALELRVAVERGASDVEVASSTKAVIRDTSGRVLGELPEGVSVDAELSGGRIRLGQRWAGQQLWLEPTAGGLVWIGDRWYRGRALLVPQGGGVTAVNYIDLEYYLYSVLGAEMNGNWPQEALKAQAVAARSYALFKRQGNRNPVFDVGDTVTWQVYKGVATESPGTQMAVNATAGQVLTYRGQIIEAVFHSSAGGYTENVENVWQQPLPYLRAVQDYDQGTPHYQWTKSFSREQLRSRITGIGNIRTLEPQRVSNSGRIITMRIIGDSGSRIMSGNELRDALDLKSTLFTVTPMYPGSPNPDVIPISSGGKSSGSVGKSVVPIGFQINGRGFGHGLGMSQWGAYNLAQQGYTYQQIVLHYYKNTTLSRIVVK